MNTNEKGQILYATFLPIVVLVAILLGAGFFLLKGEYKLPQLRKDVTEIKRLEGFPTIASDTKISEKQRRVITSEAELNEFLNEIDPSGTLILKEDINFDKEVLIGVATETKDTYGHDIKIKKLIVDEEDNKIMVQVRERRPGKYCDNDTVPNVAVDIAAMTKTDMEIEFERIKEDVDCDEPNI